MAASLIENKNLKTQRSVSHAGFISAMTNTDGEGLLQIVPERVTGSPSVSASNLNDSGNSGNKHSLTESALGFHPMKSYKTGNISDSSLSMMTEIGPVFTTDSPTKNGRDMINNMYNNNRNSLLDSKPIRASKSTLDLPSLSDQEFISTASEGDSKNKKSFLFVKTDFSPNNDKVISNSVNQDEPRKRHKSATSTPSPTQSPTIVYEFDKHRNGESTTANNIPSNNNNDETQIQEKPKKRRSFRLKTKSNNKEKEKDKGTPTSLSPSNVKNICSSPGKAAPEITVDKCDDDFEQEEDDDDIDEEPRIGSWEWCRLRWASPVNGLVCAGEIGPAIAVGLNIGSSIVTSNGIPIGADQLLLKDSSSIVPIPVGVLPMTVEPSDSSDTEAVLESELRSEISALPLVVPLPSPNLEVIDTGGESAIPFIQPICPVDHSSIGKEMLNTTIPCDIDQLFTMLFTSSKFYLDFQTSRKTFDMNQCEWQLKDGSHKTRQLSFTVLTGQSLGPKTAQVTETQTLLPASRPGLLYAIQSESVNAGIPYADAFSVNCHYCLTKLSPHESNITVISKIHYKKSVWAKSFIEKNSMAALTDFFSHLERALKEECAKSSSGSIIPASPVIISSLPRRRHHRKKCRAPDIPASALTRPNIESSSIHQVGTLRSSINTAIPDTLNEGSGSDAMEGSLIMKIILTVLGCLLLLNAFLYFKLSNLETTANLSVLYPPAVQFSGEAPQTHEEWLMLLQQQETLHRSEVQGWHEILVSAIKILHQAEKDLESLKSHISTYGSGNVIVKPVSRDDNADIEEKEKSEQPEIVVSPETLKARKDGISQAINNVKSVRNTETSVSDQ